MLFVLSFNWLFFEKMFFSFVTPRFESVVKEMLDVLRFDPTRKLPSGEKQ